LAIRLASATALAKIAGASCVTSWPTFGGSHVIRMRNGSGIA